jgi:futalosine hydrolase
MNILIVTAVPQEQKAVKDRLAEVNALNAQTQFLCTGPSVPFTVFELTSYIENRKPIDLCINAGICGSFSREYPVGTVLNIKRDTFADIGIAKTEQTLDMFEAGLWQPNQNGFTDNVFESTCKIPVELPEVSGITVNITSGRKEQIRERIDTYNPETESMEGAAFAYVCKKYKLPWLQIRAVSNLIAERHLQTWNISLALEQLAKAVADFLDFPKISKSK